MLTADIKQLISNAKNICVIPSQTNEPESLTAALALFYTLKELRKNVNLIAEDFSEKLQFLIPSLDFISQPQSFVISVPRSAADISQIYYEKNEEYLKIHLTIDKGQLKKDDISFYLSNAKPDLIITLGIQNFQKELSGRLDSFGFLLDAPIINIDNNLENLKFGSQNLVEQKSISEMLLETIIPMASVNKNVADCLLSGIVIFYDNFKRAQQTPAVFQIAGELIKRGADHHAIISNIYRSTEQEILFLGKIFENIKNENGTFTVELSLDDFSHFSESQAAAAIEKINAIGMQNDILVLWKSHGPEPTIKGFFQSQKPATINKFAEYPNSKIKNGWVFLQIPGENTNFVKQEILNIL